MKTVRAKKSNSRSVAALLLVIFVEAAVVLFLVSSDYARESTLKEGAWISASLGDETNVEIQRRADAMYENTVLQWDLDGWFRRLFIPSESERLHSRGLENLGETAFSVAVSRWEAFLDMTYWAMRRIALFSIWLPIWLPAFVISAMGGWLERAVKRTDFGYTSPFVFSYSWRTLVCAFLALVISFLCPTPLPPSLVPALLGVIAILLGLCFGNIQKRI